MEFADETAWNNAVAANDDKYGRAIHEYAKRWAELMEDAIADGATVEACAKELSHLADTEGITGFMYGCAVGLLARSWKHGENLRRWHNRDVQIRDEGERANESGGVLDPAVLVIGGRDGE